MRLNPYAKALIAGLVAGFSSLQVAAADSVISSGDWYAVASATVAAFGFVWAVPNAPERR